MLCRSPKLGDSSSGISVVVSQSVSPSLVLSFSHPPQGSTMDEMRTGDPGRERKRTFHFYLLQARRTGEEMATSEGDRRGPYSSEDRGGGGSGGTLRKQQKMEGVGGEEEEELLAHCSEASELMGRNAEPRKNWGREEGRRREKLYTAPIRSNGKKKRR